MRWSHLFFLIFFVWVAGCSEREKPLSLSVVQDWPGYSPVILAARNMQKDHQTARLKMILSSDLKNSEDLLRAGACDMICTTLTNAVQLKGEGVPLKIVRILHYSSPLDAIVSGKDIQSLSDLKGKTIGIGELNSFSDLFVSKSLEEAGLSLKDYSLKIVPPEGIADAILSGKISAGHTYFPSLQTALQKGLIVLTRASEKKIQVCDVLVCRSETIERSGKTLHEFLSRIDEASELIQSDTQHHARELSKDIAISRDDFIRSWESIDFLSARESDNELNRHLQGSRFSDAIKSILEFSKTRGHRPFRIAGDDFIYSRQGEHLE